MSLKQYKLNQSSLERLRKERIYSDRLCFDIGDYRMKLIGDIVLSFDHITSIVIFGERGIGMLVTCVLIGNVITPKPDGSHIYSLEYDFDAELFIDFDLSRYPRYFVSHKFGYTLSNRLPISCTSEEIGLSRAELARKMTHLEMYGRYAIKPIKEFEIVVNVMLWMNDTVAIIKKFMERRTINLGTFNVKSIYGIVLDDATHIDLPFPYRFSFKRIHL